MYFPSPSHEDGEIHSQQYSQEYSWLGPYLMRNTWGQYILIFLAVLITPVILITILYLVSQYPSYAWKIIKSLYERTFSASVWH